MAAPVKGRDHSISKVRVSRQAAVVHSRAGCDGPGSRVATVVLPRVGLRGGVLHLPALLSGAGLLRRGVPPPDETGPEAASEPPLRAGSGGPGRSLPAAAGLPGTAATGARDRSTFRRWLSFWQHRGAIARNGNEQVHGRGFPRSAPVSAASSRHPHRLHPVWAGFGRFRCNSEPERWAFGWLSGRQDWKCFEWPPRPECARS